MHSLYVKQGWCSCSHLATSVRVMRRCNYGVSRVAHYFSFAGKVKQKQQEKKKRDEQPLITFPLRSRLFLFFVYHYLYIYIFCFFLLPQIKRSSRKFPSICRAITRALLIKIFKKKKPTHDKILFKIINLTGSSEGYHASIMTL